jgi:hypothetical protein
MTAARKITRRGHPYIIAWSLVFLMVILSWMFPPQGHTIFVLFGLLPVLIYMWFFNSADGQKQKRLLKKGDVVYAKITSFYLGSDKLGKMAMGYYLIGAAYDYQDKHYEAKTKMYPISLFKKIDFKFGDMVTVYVDKNQPDTFIVYEASIFKVMGA